MFEKSAKARSIASFQSMTNEFMEFPAKEIGIRIAPGGHIYLPPNIAGYDGADHTAMLVSTELGSRQDTVIALDVGTTTEISLIHQGRISTCSCASGEILTRFLLVFVTFVNIFSDI